MAGEGRRVVITEEGALDVRGESVATGVLVSTLAGGYVEPFPLRDMLEVVSIEGGEVQVLRAIREVVQAQAPPARTPRLVARLRAEARALQAQVIEAQEKATTAQEHALGQVWLTLPAGGDLVGRGHDEVSVLETGASWVAGGCAGLALAAGGFVIILAYPASIGVWYRALGVIACVQLAGAVLQALARVRRTWRFWAPVKGEGGKLQVRRVRKGAGLDVWAERRGKLAWVPAGEFCWLHEEGPESSDEEEADEED